jgi:hypothetical protein
MLVLGHTLAPITQHFVLARSEIASLLLSLQGRLAAPARYVWMGGQRALSYRMDVSGELRPVVSSIRLRASLVATLV